MTGPEQPKVLVIEHDCVDSKRIAAMLEEAGIAAIAVPDWAAALAAASRGRYELAIAATSPPDARRRPGLDLLLLSEAGIAEPVAAARTPYPRDPRRFLGRVRERLLCGRPRQPGDEAAAEFAVASAKLACLHHRRRAAHHAGSRRLAEELRHEIAETALCRRALRRAAAEGLSASAARSVARR